ncbi:MAG: hypothetical protein AB7F28_08635 [Candidatus Margulisiibacteriota bacterium]
MRHFVLICFMICLFYGRCTANGEQGGKDFALLNVGLGGRATGMGNAYSALATDGNSAFWNPAGMLFARAFELSSMQTKLPSDLDVYYLTSVFQEKKDKNKPNSAWGIYWINGAVQDIPRVTANEDTGPNTDVKPASSFSYHAQVIGLSYAGWLDTNLAYGINVSGFYQEFSSIQNGKGYGGSITPSLLWMPSPRLMVGTVLRDLINTQKWETGSVEDIIPEWRVGASLSILDPVLVTAEIRQKLRARYAPTFHIGSEYNFGFLRIRGGFDESHYTAGCGVYAGPIDLQYAYVGNDSDGIGDNHRISIGFGL